MTDDTLSSLRSSSLPSQEGDGGLISSDGGLVLLREAERRFGLAGLLAGCLRDRRDPALVGEQVRLC